MADKYGIPEGGDPYPGKIRHWQGVKYAMTYNELAAVIKYKWPRKHWATAIAVAKAESNGQLAIYNTYKKGHFGLFQISRSAHPDFFKGDSVLWANPSVNAERAYKIFQSQGWKAWEGYTSGRHLGYMIQAEAAAKRAATADDHDLITGADLARAVDKAGADKPDPALAVDLAGAGEAVAGALTPDWAGDAVGVLKDAYETITTPSVWMRIGYGALGVVLVAGGLFLIVRNSAVRGAAGTVAAAVKGAS